MPIARGFVCLVPVFYLGLVLRLQPADRFGDPEAAPALGRAIYDDYDVGAYVLRGLNAHRGRRPGRSDEPEHLGRTEYAAALDDRGRPLAPRYFIEYPLTCLPLFRLGFTWQGEVQAPAALGDGDYHDLVQHSPRPEAEEHLWHQCRNAARTHMVVMLLCLLGLMVTLATGYEPGAAGPFWLLVLPGALYFSLNRFDVLPALLTALSLASLGRSRPSLSAVLLALATAVKVYPILLAPLVCRYLWDRRGGAVRWGLVYAAALLLIQLPPALLWGSEAVWMPYQYQLNRRPEGPTVYGYLLPAWMAQNEPTAKLLRLGILGGTLALLLARRIPNLDSLLRRGALIVMVFVTLAVFYSPQWVLWLAPLLIPLARSRRWLLGLLIILDGVTYLAFPIIWDGILGVTLRTELGTAVIVSRFVVMFGIAAILLWDDVTSPARLRAAEEGS